MAELKVIAGFPVDLERHYATGSHLWVTPVSAHRLRIGLDALGVETAGTLAALELAAVGTAVACDEPFGSLEAAKFVGPLVLPVGGRIVAVNGAAVFDPSLTERHPYGDGWLVEVEVDDIDAELDRLLTGPGAVATWWDGEVERYRLAGVLAQ